MTHKQGAGRPREVDRQAVIEAIEADSSTSCQMLANQFECAPNTIWHILHEAGKQWLKSKWVPHELTMDQQGKRFNACVDLFGRYSRNELNLEHIVACDEKWIALIRRETTLIIDIVFCLNQFDKKIKALRENSGKFSNDLLLKSNKHGSPGLK